MTASIASSCVKRRPPRARIPVRPVLWVLGVPVAIMFVLYLVLLITPIPLTMMREPVRTAIESALPEGAGIALGEMSLVLERGVYPVLQFSPVIYTDAKTGGKVQIDALKVGFSPFRALTGQPGAFITIERPRIQVVQDLFGPRLSSLEVIEHGPGIRPTVQVQQGEDVFPSVAISTAGIDVHSMGPDGVGGDLRSDNDWLIYNMESAEQNLRDIVRQAEDGLFSRLIIRDGVMDMHDSVYGFLRQFTGISVDIRPGRRSRPTVALFSAALGGRVMNGRMERVVETDGSSTLTAALTNLDFAAVMPFIDDADSPISIKGAGALSADMRFDGDSGKIQSGKFHLDMTGTDMRIGTDMFPVVSSVVEIDWEPEAARFTMAEGTLRIGQSAARVSGTFVLGLDETYGPTMGMALKAREVVLHPNDMGAPTEPFDEIEFSGWSAPLYGALGIDQLVAIKGDARAAVTGRVDMLQEGMGLDVTLAGEKLSADDLKRLWPYILADDSREWFVSNVSEGVLESAVMHFDFPAGTLPEDGEDKPVPPNSMTVDMTGHGVVMRATDKMAPVAVDGKTQLQIRDSRVTISAGGGQIDTPANPLKVARPALVIDTTADGRRVMEFSGDVTGNIPSLLALTRQQGPELIDGLALPVDLDALTGAFDIGVVATLLLGAGDGLEQMDYVLNGTVANFGSKTPIQSRIINKGNLAFSASQEGYSISGTAEVDGMPAVIEVSGEPNQDPDLLLSATLTAADIQKMGFDVSKFLSGEVLFAAKPLADGRLQLAVDLENAALTIADIGIRKARGVKGVLQAVVSQKGKITTLSQIALGFGDVRLEGQLEFDEDAGLRSAAFSSFALSPGDNAQVQVTPIAGGYGVQIAGAQLDLKPMLQRFFGLDEGAGGVQSSSFTQALDLKVQLQRALGFYKTTAFNMDLDLSLRGANLNSVQMQAQLGNGRSVSIATNPAPQGRVMSVAFNDFGTLLRLIGVYPRVEGGDGSLVMTTNTKLKVDAGEFQINNFALIDENNVAQILGNHQDSRRLIAAQNKLEFRRGRASFVRSGHRVEVSDGLLSGDTVGGTARGFIYTDKREYDLVGTYVPLFGLNSVFQKLPIFGPLLGGREGEGLLGVTFAVRGPLDNPQFKINPASILAVGALRSLFEFRARGEPQAQ